MLEVTHSIVLIGHELADLLSRAIVRYIKLLGVLRTYELGQHPHLFFELLDLRLLVNMDRR